MSQSKVSTDDGQLPIAGPATGGAYVAQNPEAAVVAERLIALGFPLVPLYGVYFAHSGATGECNYLGTPCPSCEAGGKHPVGKGWSDPVKRAERADLSTASTWERCPVLGIGIVTGLELRSGKYLFIIDVDVAGGKPGLESLEALENRLGALPETVSVRTGSGGLQLYFVTDEPLRNSQGKHKRVLAPGIDTRGLGGYGVAPPSMHKTGSRYEWITGKAPWEVVVADLPSRWADAVKGLRGYEPERASRVVECTESRFSLATAKKLAIAVVMHPAWRWAAENPDDLDRMTWMGFASNLLAACDGHCELFSAARIEFHKLSEGYARYSKAETDVVFEDAGRFLARGGGPHRWVTMSAIPEELTTSAPNLVEEVRREVFRRSEAPRSRPGPARSGSASWRVEKPHRS